MRLESRRQLAVAFDSAPIGMAVTTASGLTVGPTPASAELLGYPAQALTGRRREDLAARHRQPAVVRRRSR